MPSIRFIKFWSVTITFLIGMVAFFIFHSSLQLSYWYLTLWIHLFILIQFLGAYFIGMNFHIESINALATTQHKILLTFDDGPHNPNTIRVLEVLKNHNVKAIFFVIGKNFDGNEAIIKQIISDGHQIANHSYSHDAWIDIWPTKKITEDFAACQTLIESYPSHQKIIRPPYGVTNPNIVRAIKKLKLTSVGWNIRSYDTSIKDVEKIKQRILSKLKPGAIILLHDRLPYMPQLLESLIPAIIEKGYSFSNKIE